eukprot:scaffold11959_cov126-Isochrysis_galbana.AAC.4
MVIHARWSSGNSPTNMWYSSWSVAACLSAAGIAVKPPGAATNCGCLCKGASLSHASYMQPSFVRACTP